MKSIIFFSLLPPFLYAIGNYIDKILIDRYIQRSGVGPLVLFSSLFAIVLLPIAYSIDPSLFSIDLISIAILIFSGCITIGAIILYLKALYKDDTSVVAPFFQLIPIFGFGLAYVFLNETLTFVQIGAALIMIVGAGILTLETNNNTLSFKKEIVFLMIGSSLLYAMREVLFKYIGLDIGFWASIFWTSTGMVLTGIFLYTFVLSYRKDFYSLLKTNKKSLLLLNLLNESVILIADLLLFYLLLVAPVALVQTFFSTQPAFVLIVGIVLTIFFPKIKINEKQEKTILIQKGIAIGLIVLGGIVLSL